MPEDSNVVRREAANREGLTSQEVAALMHARDALLDVQVILSESLRINLDEDPGATILRCAVAQLKVWMERSTLAQRKRALGIIDDIRLPMIHMVED